MKEEFQEEKWLNAVHHRMEDYTESFDDNGWEELLSDFSRTEGKGHSLFLNSRLYLSAAVIATLIAFSFALLYLLPFSKSQKIATINRHELLHHKILKETEHVDHVLAQTDKHLLARQSVNTHTAAVKAAVAKHGDDQPDKLVEEDSSQANRSTLAHENGSKKEAPQIADAKKAEQQALTVYKRKNHDGEDDLYACTSYTETKPKESGWALTLGMGGAIKGGYGSDENAFDQAGVAYMQNPYSSLVAARQSPQNNLLARASIKLKHRPPIRIGLMVSKSVTKNISIQTGLTYTYMLSVPDDEVSDEGYNRDQQLYYVGIPVKVNYNLYHMRKFSVYWSNGFEAEKCVYAKRGKRKLTVDKLQWSVNSALGAQYMLAPHIAVFAEPGFSYYWDNHDGVENFRTEHPLNFNLHFGLKLNY